MKLRQTDNSALRAKLALRRHFLENYHGKPARVLDCCQGQGVLWRQLRTEFDVALYWGIDLKAKPGRLRLDSAQLLAQNGLAYNVIDIDTYGSPWRHWLALLPHVRTATTVFLTIGHVFVGTERELLPGLGLERFGRILPPALRSRLRELWLHTCLSRPLDFGLTIAEAVEAFPHGARARYFGVRIEPGGQAGQAGRGPSQTTRKKRSVDSRRSSVAPAG